MAPVAKRKYKKEQETLEELKPHGWLRESTQPGGEAYCKICKVGIRNKLCDLKTHIIAKKHKYAMQQRDLQTSAAAFMRPSGGNVK